MAQSTPAKPAEQKPSTASPVRKDTLRGGPRYKKAVDLIDQNKPLPAEQQHAEEQEKLARLAQHQDDPTEHHDNSVEHPHAERHEFVEKGGHHEEIDYGDYVVVGVFKSRDNSEHYSKELNKLKFSTDFGYLTVKGLWYVYLEKSYDINQARADRDKFRKMKIFRDAWLLTVQ